MRNGNVGSISVSYPDELVACFGRNPIVINGFSGASVEMEVTNNYTGERRTERRAPFGDVCRFELDYFLGTLFDQSVLGDVGYNGIGDGGMVRNHTVKLYFYDTTSVSDEFTFNLKVLWAAKLPPYEQTIKMFSGYPFTVSLVTDNGESVKVGSRTYTAPSESVTIPVDAPCVVTSKYQKVTIKEGGCNDGIYLRWIDIYGRYCYWAFKKGNSTTSLTEESKFVRNKVRKSVKNVGSTMEVCAPLVDDETFDFLLNLAASPMIEMYTSEGWVMVDIEAGDIVRERTSLQDFIVTLVLPDTDVQKL